jgi:hypothetical protein
MLAGIYIREVVLHFLLVTHHMVLTSCNYFAGPETEVVRLPSSI